MLTGNTYGAATTVDGRFSRVAAACAIESDVARERLAVLVCALLHAALLSHAFFPTLPTLGMWDEAVYIERGRRLLEGNLPTLTANPLVALLYAATALPVIDSPFWLVHSAAIARVVLFVLLWTAAMLAAGRLRVVPRLLIALMLVLSPVIPVLLENGSDGLFAAMSVLTLWQVLAFRTEPSTGRAAGASVFAGLAALSRNEGLVLFALVLVLLFAMARAHRSGSARMAAGALLPFSVLVGGWIAMYGAANGEFTTGTGNRAYFSFEQGQGLAYKDRYPPGRNFWIEGQVDARRLYGTQAENGGSVLRAIARNPRAYAQRLSRIVQRAPRDAMEAYGGVFALLLFVFAVRGAVAMLRDRTYQLLAILLVWPAFLVLQFFLVYRNPHFLFAFFPLFSLAGAGIMAFWDPPRAREHRTTTWLCVAMAIAGVILLKPALILVGAAPAAGLALVRLTAGEQNIAVARSVGLMSLLVLGVLLQGGFVPRTLALPGAAPEERAVLVLRDRLSSESLVAAWAPGVVWTAGMRHASLALDLRHLNTGADLTAWFGRETISAVYVGDRLQQQEPELWRLIQQEIGRSLQPVFSADGGRVQVLLVKGRT